MKKVIIGSIVGGIILFIWQFLSWSLLDMHHAMKKYTPNQDSILHFLSSQLPDEGTYMLPTMKEGASMDDYQKLSAENAGKPWAMVAYHKSLNVEMTPNMIRGILVDIVTIALFCWILSGLANPRFGNIFVISILIGLIGFFSLPYTNSIWYKNPDINAHLVDAIASWGLIGIWLGWWYGRK